MVAGNMNGMTSMKGCIVAGNMNGMTSMRGCMVAGNMNGMTSMRGCMVAEGELKGRPGQVGILQVGGSQVQGMLAVVGKVQVS